MLGKRRQPTQFSKFHSPSSLLTKPVLSIRLFATKYARLVKTKMSGMLDYRSWKTSCCESVRTAELTVPSAWAEFKTSTRKVIIKCMLVVKTQPRHFSKSTSRAKNGTRNMAENAVCPFAQKDPRDTHPTPGQGQQNPACQPPLWHWLCAIGIPHRIARARRLARRFTVPETGGNTNNASANFCECENANASLCDQKYRTRFGGILKNQRLQNRNDEWVNTSKCKQTRAHWRRIPNDKNMNNELRVKTKNIIKLISVADW